MDYEDIEEQYEGPEVQAITEEDYLLPEKDYVSTQVSASVKGATSVFDDENYDEESEKENEADENNNTEVQTTTLSGFFYCDLNSLFNGRSDPFDSKIWVKKYTIQKYRQIVIFIMIYM